MGQGADGPLILIGFSGTGKSAIARMAAERLGWTAVDTDDEVVRLSGKSIPNIFREDGEPHFRKLERQALLEACRKPRCVIATGGGAVVDPANRMLMRRSGMVVCLEANPGTIFRRLPGEEESPAAVRPLLAMSDPMERIVELKHSRQAHYAIADWTVQTDHLTLDEVCREVLRGRHYWLRSQRSAASLDDDHVCDVLTAAEQYPVFAGWGLRKQLGAYLKQTGLGGNIYLIADATVFSLWGESVSSILRDAGFPCRSLVVPAGESSKTPESVGRIHEWLVDCRAERGDTVVSLGGGMITDMAGFAASTFLRGLPLVHLPASLIAMTDAAVGGKTGVNHPRAKNLIGSFYQPRMVLADVEFLGTLPAAELTSGWAEVIKHGLVLDPGLGAFLEDNADRLINLDPQLVTRAVRHSMAVKAVIVSEDEKETGSRILLNYGHTIGHGLEAATEYQGFLHGEAVSIGMMGAARLSRALGLLAPEIVEKHREILTRFGLPVSYSGVDVERILQSLALDKKVKGRSIRWVLLRDIGQPVIKGDVPLETISRVLKELEA